MPDPNTRPLHLEICDRIAHIRLDRPDRLNAMGRDFWTELPALVRDISDNARARVIVLSSTGKHFSAGMDLSVFADDPALSAPPAGDGTIGNEAFQHLVALLQRSFSCLEAARMPVLAAIQGGCIGGAVDMISACDIRYATEDAFFQIQEINLGMTADVGTFPRLCKLLPDGALRELAYTGRRLPSRKAQALGLVTEVYPDQPAMLAAVMSTAREIAEKAPLAIAGSKMMINYARDHTIAEALDRIALWQAGMHSRSAMAEALKAQQERRAPQFPDLAKLRQEL